MLNKIEALLDNLRRSERKVADLVLARPNHVVNMSMAELAKGAGVSEPTVLRFCRAVGCSGFQNMKMRLIGDLARTIPFVHRDVQMWDPVSEISSKIFDRTISTLMRVKSQVDGDVLEKASQLLSESSRIEFFGSGASGLVAMDAQNKFFRLGVPCNACCDHHTQGMIAAILKEDAVVVAFSTTGSSKSLLRNVQLASASGASVIAITSPGSPLAETASVAITIDIEEDTQIQTPMTSRIIHLMLVDILMVSCALKLGPGATRHMERAKASLEDQHLPK